MADELTLADRLELHELPGRYGDAIDDRAWDRLGRVFTPDAVFDLPHLGVTLRGLDEIVRYMEEEAPHPLAHLMMNVYADATDAGARLNVRAMFPVRDDSGARGRRVVFGSYYDDVVKTADGWRVKSRVFSLERVDKRRAAVDDRLDPK
jgi:hypothetical protein